MSARCHLERVALYTHGAVALAPGETPVLVETVAPHAQTAESCEYCASLRLEWRKCKQVCRDCGQINRSCADL